MTNFEITDKFRDFETSMFTLCLKLIVCDALVCPSSWIRTRPLLDVFLVTYFTCQS